jgi:hypothetical protein
LVYPLLLPELRVARILGCPLATERIPFIAVRAIVQGRVRGVPQFEI